MKKRTITIEIELELPDDILYVAFSKDGELLLFTNRPEKHPLGDWSNRWLSKSQYRVKNYERTRRSVK